MSPVSGTNAGRAAWFVAAVGLCMTGCGNHNTIEPRPGPLEGVTSAQAHARAEQVRRDPVAYIRQVADRCRALEQYTVTFTRQERRGWFGRLHDPERIQCWFRREPFSIRMKWLDPDIKHGEATYVAGKWDDKVRFVPRHGFFGLPPSVIAVELRTPVIWGEAKYPLTDFGLERVMERTLASLAAAGEDVTVRYVGLKKLPDSGRVVHHLHLEYSPRRQKVPVQELYIDVVTNLPACTVLKYASGRLDAAYIYDKLNFDVALTDEDFRLDFERRQREDSTAELAADSSSE